MDFIAGGDSAGAEWHVFQARVEIQVDRKARRGALGEVDVLINGHAVAEISVWSERVDGLRAIEWATNELFSGPSSGVAFGEVVRFGFENYAQTGSVRKGENVLTLRLHGYFGTPIRSAVVEPGASVTATDVAPAKLTFGAGLENSSVTVGSVFAIHYALASGGLPAREVGVLMSPMSASIVPLVSSTRFWSWAQSREGDIEFLPLAAGLFHVRVFGSAATGTGGAGGVLSQTVTVRVWPAGARHH